MSPDEGMFRFVRAALDEIGITLQDDVEYEEVALRVAVVIEGVCSLIAELPHEFGALVPGDIPTPLGLVR